MKVQALLAVLLLSACGGLTQEQFYEDTNNTQKATELSGKAIRTSDCDKIGQLYEFSVMDNPTASDLEAILPLLGVQKKDFKNIDKLYTLDLSAVDKLKCEDNRDKLGSEARRYCEDKYYDEYGIETAMYFPFRLVSTVSVFTIVGAIPFMAHSCGMESVWHPIACNRMLDCRKHLMQTVNTGTEDYSGVRKSKIKERIQAKIRQIYAIPNICKNYRTYTDAYGKTTKTYDEEFHYAFSEFKPSEMIAAANKTIGTYDKDCINGTICDNNDTKIVTGANAAKALYNACIENIGIWRRYEEDTIFTCSCFARSAYKNLSYKNVLYIYENDDFPQSKEAELTRQMRNCKNKWDKQVAQQQITRYGETTDGQTNSDVEAAINNVVDAVQNAVWMNEQLTEKRKEIENLRDLDI